MAERRCVSAGKDGHRCSGKPQWHHPIKKQRIRSRFTFGARFVGGAWVAATRHEPVRRSSVTEKTLRALLTDPRNRIWACKDVHDAIEGDYSNLPAPVWDFAREFGMVGMLENDIARKGGVRAH